MRREVRRGRKFVEYHLGIQSISNNGIVSEPYGGTFRVLADIVRATD